MEIKYKSSLLRKFVNDIQRINRNPQKDDARVIQLIDKMETNPERIITTGTKLYRCRIIHTGSSLCGKAPFFGFDADNSLAPPWQRATDMRASYRYIPYLYCANHPYLSLVEVRPRIGAKVSIAEILVRKDITLLDFTAKTKPKGMDGTKQNLFHDLSLLYSKPVSEDDEVIDYIPTQYIAEYAKRLGYGGIIYMSSLTPEINESGLDRFNVVIFDYKSVCEVVKTNVIEVLENNVDCDNVDGDHDPIIVKNYLSELIGTI